VLELLSSECVDGDERDDEENEEDSAEVEASLVEERGKVPALLGGSSKLLLADAVSDALDSEEVMLSPLVLEAMLCRVTGGEPGRSEVGEPTWVCCVCEVGEQEERGAVQPAACQSSLTSSAKSTIELRSRARLRPAEKPDTIALLCG